MKVELHNGNLPQAVTHVASTHFYVGADGKYYAELVRTDKANKVTTTRYVSDEPFQYDVSLE